MFRKILLGSIAALGLMATAVAPIDAHASHAHGHAAHGHAGHARNGHHGHRHGYRRVRHGPYAHRAFGSWADANTWMLSQRAAGFDCYTAWHGPQCWVYYR